MMLRCVLSIYIISIALSASGTDISTGINSFANKLFNVLATKGKNLVFSPFSAHAALALTYQGAGPETARSFQQCLSVPEIQETARGYKTIVTGLNSAHDVHIHVANKIYLKEDFKLKEDFRSIAKDYFSADVENIDFLKPAKAANAINAWVKQKTHDKITELVSAEDFDEYTRAVLLNAIYFQGNWVHKFDPNNTRTQKFHLSETVSKECKMMSQINNFQYGESTELDAKILKMRYKDNRFQMVIVLPNSKTGLEELQKKLVNQDISTLNTARRRVILSLPKFKFETSLQLKNPLEQIGLSNIFSNAADFSNMIDSTEKIKVDKVVQKVYIDVTEHGSEAAAATGVVMRWRTAMHHVQPPAQFKADHPFIFYITADLAQEGSDATTNILFMGKIESPD